MAEAVSKPSEVMKFTRPPRLHQALTLDRFAPEPEMALIWEMGTGKSTEAILWLRAKYNIAKEVTRTLIVSPCATLYNWQNEFALNAPERVCSEVLVPYMRTKRTKYTLAERAKLVVSGPKIIIVNPESFDDRVMVEALKQFAPQNVVIDEVDGWKKPHLSTKKAADGKKSEKPTRLGSLISVTDRAQNRAIMTGTLILNGYLDIWAQWRILDKGASLGSNYFTFRARYFEDKNLGMLQGNEKAKRAYFPNWQPKAGIEAELTALIDRKASRITKEECLDLPPLIELTRHVEMGKDQEKAYREIEKQLITEISGGTCAVTNALSKLMRLDQILAGFMPILIEDGNEDVKAMHFFKSNPRMDELRRMLEELTPRSKVIVWVTYAGIYPKIRELFAELGIEYAEITGESKDHHGNNERFRTDPKCRVMLSNPKAGGIGINMVEASESIYYNFNHSRREREQSKARNHRGGSEMHKVITHVTLVCEHSHQPAVLDALARKEEFSENILGRLQKLYLGDKTGA